jgi:hypothetical protein
VHGVGRHIRHQIHLMFSTSTGKHMIRQGARYPLLTRIAVAISSLCYSAVGVAYGRVGDSTGQALFLTVGIFSAIADGHLFDGTPAAPLAGLEHILDRWIAVSGGIYFVVPRLPVMLEGHWEDGVATLALLMSTLCLRTARKQVTEERWAAWQILWHVLSAGSMIIYLLCR